MTFAETSWTVAQVRELVASRSPMVSLYLGTDVADHLGNPTQELALRWRPHAAHLAAQGVDGATLDAISSYVNWLPVAPSELAIFAADGAVRIAAPMPDAAPFELARFTAPPYVLPVLRWLHLHPAHVIVMIDRTGADITAVPAGSGAGTTRTVVGPDDEIERNKPGGWSQPRYHRRAEDSWLHNAAAVAAATADAVARVGAGLLLVGGDVRAVQLLQERLPVAVARRTRMAHLPGSRAEDGSGELRRRAIEAAVAEYATATAQGLLDRFAATTGTANGVAGVTATLAALVEGRVDTLFVADDPLDDRVAWFGSDLLCVQRPDLAPVGTGADLRSGNLVDVAVRAALLTDARVITLDPRDADQLTERIGALCRFS